jgi:AbrB family looped-hinge helix DNA binding protein
MQETIITTLSTKGQVTIPAQIRKILHVSNAGDLISFTPMENGVLIKHVEIKEENFTEDEYDKLEKIANKKGKAYKNAKFFLKALKKL